MVVLSLLQLNLKVSDMVMIVGEERGVKEQMTQVFVVVSVASTADV